MKIKSTVFLVLFVAGLGTLVPGAAAEDLCARFEVSSVEDPRTFGVGKFSAVKTSDLKIHVVLPNEVRADHVITIRFHTPNGHLYREFDIPIAPTGTRAPGTRRLPDYPYPVEVKVPSTMRVSDETVFAVETRFPVGGTSIVSSSLYGSWTVTGLIDGKELRCFRPLTIMIFQ